MSEIINVENASIGYRGGNILNVNLRINKGDFWVISGNNAVGKSLFLKLLYMKIFPLKGSLFLFGEKITQNSKEKILKFRRQLGVILQNDYLIPFFTVSQNVEFSSLVQRENFDYLSRSKEILSWLGLTNIKDTPVSKLSNGQKQKVVIARALITNPKIIIADQPDTNLDKQSTKKIFFLFESINKLGTTIIITTKNSEILPKVYKTLHLKDNEK